MTTTVLGISLTDWLGYIAMVILLISFLMKDVKTLRIVNSFGCFAFAIWGILIEEWPVVITNIAILGINIYYLTFRLNKGQKPDNQ